MDEYYKLPTYTHTCYKRRFRKRELHSIAEKKLNRAIKLGQQVYRNRDNVKLFLVDDIKIQTKNDEITGLWIDVPKAYFWDLCIDTYNKISNELKLPIENNYSLF